MPLSLSEAAVLSVPLEAILYGFSLFMFYITTRTLFRDRKHRKLNHGMICASFALLVLSTVEMGVNMTRLYQGFISKGPHLPGGSEQYFGSASQPTFLVKSCLYNAQTIILDAVVIHRTLVVWQYFPVVIVPIMGWLGLVIACVGLNYSFTQMREDLDAGDVYSSRTGPWVTAVYSLTLGTNLLTTLILSYKIWSVARRSARFLSESSLTPFLRLVAESGALYSMTITAALIASLLKTNAVYVILDMISPIISIAFSMIIVHVSLSKDDCASKKDAISTQSWMGASPRRNRRAAGDESTFQVHGIDIITVEMNDVVFRNSPGVDPHVDESHSLSGDVKTPPGIGSDREREEALEPPTKSDSGHGTTASARIRRSASSAETEIAA